MLHLTGKQSHDLITKNQQYQHQVNGKQNVWKVDFYLYAPEIESHFHG
jgi:hypothetical protein